LARPYGTGRKQICSKQLTARYYFVLTFQPRLEPVDILVITASAINPFNRKESHFVITWQKVTGARQRGESGWLSRLPDHH